ncbi:hypothetical protein HA402_008717 [Bradysia odoriphaga]|nr:hypothetical protein HA402_008717 [Bradysia odoriphaga]
MEFEPEVSYTISVNRKKKFTSKADLEKFTREELINRILQIQAHNNQLINLLKKEQVAAAAEKASSSKEDGKPKDQRKFQFPTSYKRHILLKLYYLGWDYQGFITQEHTSNTIEHHLFKSLVKVCLIENRESSNYHRCGRTDKGVSAFSQVISLDIRSKFAPEIQMTEESLANEINYCEALNRVLPANIKCVAWAPFQSPLFSARFDCKFRTYRYFFPRGCMDIDMMKEGCSHLEGVHDFRNLCKMDVANGVVTFVREIKSAKIHLASKSLIDPSYDMLYMELTGSAYLWHQVRCIMAILMLVGQKLESPNVVAQLLDVEKTPCTPQYSMASDVALNLYDVEYKEASDYREGEEFELVNWIYEEVNIRRVLKTLQGQWTISSVQTTMMHEMLSHIQDIYVNHLKMPTFNSQIEILLEGVRSKQYQPLMTRTTCESLENRIAHFAKKRRIEVSKNQEED